MAIVLKRHGLNARAMHADLTQNERDKVMNLFRAHKIDLLVATDIVARGIDIDDITMVINYDAPHDAEDYVHRIGRTARAGRQGSAVTLIGEKDLIALANIERTLNIKIPRAELPEGVRPPQKILNRDVAIVQNAVITIVTAMALVVINKQVLTVNKRVKMQIAIANVNNKRLVANHMAKATIGLLLNNAHPKVELDANLNNI